MKYLLFFQLLPSGLTPLYSQNNGVGQSSQLLTVPAGDKFLTWYGHAGRSYFVQISDPSDPLGKWPWAPLIEGGNDEERSYEVDGTASQGFFRLKYTDQVPGPNETLDSADFDADGISNWDESTVYSTDPLNAADADTDADGDGLSNPWEFKLGLNPRLVDSDGNGISDAQEDRDQDSLTNISEIAIHGTDPTQPDTDGDGLNDGWEILYGYSALINNETDADSTNDPEADPDNDGLLNSDQ